MKPIAPHPSKPPGLLVLPGWDDDGRDQFERLEADLAIRGWVCGRADLPDATWPAHRRDSINREETLRQARADFDELTDRADPHAIAVLGFSYGGYMAALLTAQREIAWMILRAPAFYPDHDWLTPKSQLDKREIAHYRDHEEPPMDNKALAACRHFRGDVLLIQGEHDEVIPSPVIDSYQDALKGAHSVTRSVLPGADHELTREESRIAYHRWVVEWLCRRAGRPA